MPLSNKSGFSLLEATVVIGLLAFAAIGSIRVNENVRKTTKTSEISMGVNAFANSLTQTLLNYESCFNTFNGLGPIVEGLSVNQIKNRVNGMAFDTIQKYSDNRIQIAEMTVTEVNISPPPLGFSKKFGEFKLKVKLKKLGKGFLGSNYLYQKFPLSGEFDLSNNLTKCYSSSEDAIQTSIKNSCRNLGGSWDEPTQTCALSTVVGKKNALSTEDLDNNINDLLNNFLPTNYVQKAGDTMTGTLTISGADLNAKVVNATNSLKAANSVCVGTRCRDFSQKECGKNFIMVGENEDGSPICTALECPNGFYFEKFDPTTGNVLCKAIPSKTCSLNQYISEIKLDRTIICSPLPPGINQQCPNGQYTIRTAPNGVITCSNPNINLSCGVGTFVRGFDSNGFAYCR